MARPDPVSARAGRLRGIQRHHRGVPWQDRPVPAASSSLDPAVAARLKRDDAGLFCAVVQDHDTREVLMVGWMDDEALHRTLTTGRVTFWSRSRKEYWRKGDSSGNVQHVRSCLLYTSPSPRDRTRSR